VLSSRDKFADRHTDEHAYRNTLLDIQAYRGRSNESMFIRNESVPKIIINNTINLFLKLQSAFCEFHTITVSECCLIKLLPYILFEKNIYTLAL